MFNYQDFNQQNFQTNAEQAYENVTTDIMSFSKVVQENLSAIDEHVAALESEHKLGHILYMTSEEISATLENAQAKLKKSLDNRTAKMYESVDEMDTKFKEYGKDIDSISPEQAKGSNVGGTIQLVAAGTALVGGMIALFVGLPKLLARRAPPKTLFNTVYATLVSRFGRIGILTGIGGSILALLKMKATRTFIKDGAKQFGSKVGQLAGKLNGGKILSNIRSATKVGTTTAKKAGITTTQRSATKAAMSSAKAAGKSAEDIRKAGAAALSGGGILGLKKVLSQLTAGFSTLRTSMRNCFGSVSGMLKTLFEKSKNIVPKIASKQDLGIYEATSLDMASLEQDFGEGAAPDNNQVTYKQALKLVFFGISFYFILKLVFSTVCTGLIGRSISQLISKVK